MAGWEQVLDQTVRTRWGPLVGYASLFAIDRSEAEDLVQEALVRTFARTRALTDQVSAEAYVKAAIRTSFLDRARKSKGFAGRAHLLVADDARGPEAGVVAGYDVGAALRSLPPRERACVVLRFFDDLPIAEVAAELELSEGAVKRYLSDAVGRLRDLLGDGVAFTQDPTPTTRVATVPERRNA